MTASNATEPAELVDGIVFGGLSSRQAEMVSRQVRRVEKETDKPGLAKEIGKRLADGMRLAMGLPPVGKQTDQQAVTYHGAKAAADQMTGKDRRADKITQAIPPINKFAEELALKLADAFPTRQMLAKIDALITHRADLSSKERRLLVGAIRALAKRADRLANKLEG
jgi:hypothetical protein